MIKEEIFGRLTMEAVRNVHAKFDFGLRKKG
jgi:hypothetical protein